MFKDNEKGQTHSCDHLPQPRRDLCDKCKPTESSHVEFQESSGLLEPSVGVEVGEVLTKEKIEAIGKAIKHTEVKAYRNGYLAGLKQGWVDGQLDKINEK